MIYNFQILIKRFFVVFSLLIYCGIIKAQHEATFYYMDYVPQSNYTNPALVPKPKVHVGLPAISHIDIGLYHDGFTLDDFIYKRDDDSLEITVDKVINNLNSRNYISFTNNIDLISFGFKTDAIFLNFNISEKIMVKFCYPKDLITLVLKGNKHFLGNTADLSGFGLDLLHYREYGISVAKPFLNNNLFVGAKAKLLFGKANIYTEKSDITLFTDSSMVYALTAKADILIHTSPAIFGDSSNNDFKDLDPDEYFLNNRNQGFAFDLGIHYKLNNWGFNVSIIDIGFINWKSDNKSYYTENARFTFEGIELSDFFSIKGEHIDLDTTNQFEEFFDSMINTFEIHDRIQDYRSPLPSKFYLGATYNISENDKVGLLLHSEYFKRKLIQPSVTLSYYRQFGSILTLSTSYSIQNRSFQNLGLGFAARLGPIQLYLVSDNVLSPLFYENAKNASILIGLNLAFGLKKGPKFDNKALIY